MVELYLESASVLLGGSLHLLQGLVVNHDAMTESWAFSDQRDATDNTGFGVNGSGRGCECDDLFHR